MPFPTEFTVDNAHQKASLSLERKSENEVAQSCPTLCDHMDCSPPGSSIHWIFQARILEWVAISFSRGSSWPSNRIQVSCIAGRRFIIWAFNASSLSFLSYKMGILITPYSENIFFQLIEAEHVRHPGRCLVDLSNILFLLLLIDRWNQVSFLINLDT